MTKAYVSCPVSVVDAPIETVWGLLTRPERWGDFFDVRIRSVFPPGSAAVGQMALAESGPRFLRLKVELRFVDIDPENHTLAIDVRLPFGVSVREDLICTPLSRHQCRIGYRCDFRFPAGWRGAALHFVMRRGLDSGTADSLARLKRAAEAADPDWRARAVGHESEPMIDNAHAPKKLLPPVYFVAGLAMMAVLAYALPLAPLLAWPWRALGLAPIGAGVWLNLAADRAFKARGTTVKPFERSAALVTEGVFALTRNPMYLGMILILAGAAMLIGALSPFFVVAGFAAILATRFIPVEERMLAETFGDAWAAYCARTRRWI